MRAASAIVRANIGVLPHSDAHRSPWLNSGSGESMTDKLLTRLTYSVNYWQSLRGCEGKSSAPLLLH